MRKNISLDLTKTRFKDPRKQITTPIQKLAEDKFRGQTASGGSSASGYSYESSDNVAMPPRVTWIDTTWGPDMVAPGNTVEQVMTLMTGFYAPVLQAEFYRDVWFDGLEAILGVHYTVSTSSFRYPIIDTVLYPVGSPDSGVEVTARYVVR